MGIVREGSLGFGVVYIGFLKFVKDVLVIAVVVSIEVYFYIRFIR